MSDASTPAHTGREGEYTDETTPDGRHTHRDDGEPGQYEDMEQADGTRTPAHTDEEGEYTDSDL